jgi:hypothetical protein
MSLQEEHRDRVSKLLRTLPEGWKRLLLEGLGLDVAAADLASAPTATARIDRARKGFDDLDPSIVRLVEPGQPARSVLYHAFASPRVIPDSANQTWWPSPQDLDLLEDWITCLVPLAPEVIPSGAVVGMFAYEYRPASEMPHQQHAGFVYSRTGIARVGEAEPTWDGASRSWSSRSPHDKGGFAAIPARYAAFLAVPVKTGSGACLLGKSQDKDQDRTFYLPARKLVFGEPFEQGKLELHLGEYHRREKLRRLFVGGDYPTTANLQTWPYVRDSLAPGEHASGANRGPERLVDLTSLGSAVTVASPAAPLVRVAREPGGAIAILPDVPERSALHKGNFALNRSATSLRTNTGGIKLVEDAIVNGVLNRNENARPRNAPEFANIRHEPPTSGDALVDLGTTLDADFRDVVNRGGYAAVLFEDSVCDGILAVDVPALGRLGPTLPAFSVVTAPDFFPHAGEIDIQDWTDLVDNGDVQMQFRSGTPVPLCQGRLPPNLTLQTPIKGARAFSPQDDTAVAVLSSPPLGSNSTPRRRGDRGLEQSQATTFLTDGASDAFAPGWDITFSEENGQTFYSTFGLGSPFPEDVKLCAADNGFWPAASPDAGRTFQNSPTAIPLLDEELGWHPDNPRKPPHEPASWGWDGEQGPFIAPSGEVNYCDFWRSDYVSNVLLGRFGSGKLAELQASELIARMDALRACVAVLPGKTDVAHTDLWLVHAERALVPTAQNAAPSAHGYRYEFVVASGVDTSDPKDLRRRLQPFSKRFECLVGIAGVTWRSVGDGWTWSPVST